MANNSDKAATLLLALAVADAAKLREQSYDAEAAGRALKDVRSAGRWVDYNAFYKLTLDEACYRAAQIHGLCGSERLIYLALDAHWNEALAWAEAKIKYSNPPMEAPRG